MTPAKAREMAKAIVAQYGLMEVKEQPFHFGRRVYYFSTKRMETYVNIVVKSYKHNPNWRFMIIPDETGRVSESAISVISLK